MSDKRTRKAWVHGGFEDFARGRFEDGGSNLYVNAEGIIETIHRTDVNNDGYVDIVLPGGEVRLDLRAEPVRLGIERTLAKPKK